MRFLIKSSQGLLNTWYYEKIHRFKKVHSFEKSSQTFKANSTDAQKAFTGSKKYSHVHGWKKSTLRESKIYLLVSKMEMTGKNGP